MIPVGARPQSRRPAAGSRDARVREPHASRCTGVGAQQHSSINQRKRSTSCQHLPGRARHPDPALSSVPDDNGRIPGVGLPICSGTRTAVYEHTSSAAGRVQYAHRAREGRQGAQIATQLAVTCSLAHRRSESERSSSRSPSTRPRPKRAFRGRPRAPKAGYPGSSSKAFLPSHSRCLTALLYSARQGVRPRLAGSLQSTSQRVGLQARAAACHTSSGSRRASSRTTSPA